MKVYAPPFVFIPLSLIDIKMQYFLSQRVKETEGSKRTNRVVCLFNPSSTSERWQTGGS